MENAKKKKKQWAVTEVKRLGLPSNDGLPYIQCRRLSGGVSTSLVSSRLTSCAMTCVRSSGKPMESYRKNAVSPGMVLEDLLLCSSSTSLKCLMPLSFWCDVLEQQMVQVWMYARARGCQPL